MKKLVALFMALVMVLLCVPVLAENAPTVIRMGTHWMWTTKTKSSAPMKKTA